eukprot:11457289-Heterocapsa_arctica.AAC.1
MEKEDLPPAQLPNSPSPSFHSDKPWGVLVRRRTIFWGACPAVSPARNNVCAFTPSQQPSREHGERLVGALRALDGRFGGR